VGNCTGALLALATARERPQRVERLVLIDPFAYVPPYLRLFLLGGLGRIAYGAAFANPVGRWVTDHALARHRTAGTDLTQGFVRVDHAVTLAYLRAFAGLGSIRSFAAVSAPIHIVYGQRTFGAVRRSMALWRGLFPQARLRPSPRGAGRWL
jgi:pimeloyl-ACP methyl ester carboxylesterase